jgi:hypothetical protein
MSYGTQIQEWALKHFPQCYTLLRRRGYSPWKAAEIVLNAKRRDPHARKRIAAMRRCEVFERQQADYDLKRKCL